MRRENYVISEEGSGDLPHTYFGHSNPSERQGEGARQDTTSLCGTAADNPSLRRGYIAAGAF